MKPTQLLLNGNIYAYLLPGQLQQRVVHFLYAKKSNGQLREAWGTTCTEIICQRNPDFIAPAGKKPRNEAIVTYYDLQRNAWRSFSTERFYAYVVNYWEDPLPRDLVGRVHYIESAMLDTEQKYVLLHLYSPLFLRKYFEEKQGIDAEPL